MATFETKHQESIIFLMSVESL